MSAQSTSSSRAAGRVKPQCAVRKPSTRCTGASYGPASSALFRHSMCRTWAGVRPSEARKVMRGMMSACTSIVSTLGHRDTRLLSCSGDRPNPCGITSPDHPGVASDPLSPLLPCPTPVCLPAAPAAAGLRPTVMPDALLGVAAVLLSDLLLSSPAPPQAVAALLPPCSSVPVWWPARRKAATGLMRASTSSSSRSPQRGMTCAEMSRALRPSDCRNIMARPALNSEPRTNRSGFVDSILTNKCF
mmetsp:Transcript_22178/g.56350  ORF Transcript_22178/g.56350 Transcript_22178/m.56350 type:complete len:245 (-) Transcript_22178:376-1110(-)